MAAIPSSASLDALVPSVLEELAADAPLTGPEGAKRFEPDTGDSLSVEHQGLRLQTPIGVALAPDGELPRQCATAWLRGARLVQLAPTAELSAMVEQVLDSWVLVAALRHRLGSPARHPGELLHVAITVEARPDGPDTAGAVVDALGRLGAAAQPLRARQARAAARGEGLSKLQVLPRIPCSVVLQPQPDTSPQQLARLGVHLIEAARIGLSVELDPAVLGHHELSTVLTEAGAQGARELAPELFDGALHYEDAVAVLGTLAEAAARQGVELGVQLPCPAGGALGEALAQLARPLDQLPALWLAHLLSERLRARLPTSLRMLCGAQPLEPLLGAGLRPVVLSPELRWPALGPLGDAVERAGASDWDDLACRHALGLDAGKPFRRRIREHGEVNAGVCLRDRHWDAVWSAFDAALDGLTVREALERALVGQDLPAHVADAVARTAQGACHRIVLARYTAAFRSGQQGRRR